jgi:hypothetical protein
MSNSVTGYLPADVFKALEAEIPRCALFTTYTFSPGTFQQQYLTSLLQHGCRDVTVLADAVGYGQSLCSAATAQGIGTDYRLRQVSVPGAFHAKLVLVRMRRSALLGIGSGNLTASGLLTNAEVGALYRLQEHDGLIQLDNLVLRLRSIASLDVAAGDAVKPIALANDARLVTSLDLPIFDQLNLTSDVRRIEIVSPFIDGNLDVLTVMRQRWPDATIRVRVDPGFGALTDSLLQREDDGIEVQVPVEPTGDKGAARRPPVHGKLICFIGDTHATALLGSANLSRPALLNRENFEAVVEQRLPRDLVEKLLAVPHVRWRKAGPQDRRSFHPDLAPHVSTGLIATVSSRRLQMTWTLGNAERGTVRMCCRGRYVFQQRFDHVGRIAEQRSLEVQLSAQVNETVLQSSSCLVELEFPDGRLLRGWVEVADMLGLAPDAKRQLVLVDAIASDPLHCDEKDVVKFIELLQRNLRAGLREDSSAGLSRLHKHNAAADQDYDEEPVARDLLLETGHGMSFGQSLLLARLVNRTLDAALRDLHFFGRDKIAPGTRSTGAHHAGDRTRAGDREAKEQQALPPKIEKVLEQLFNQLAVAFESAQSPRQVVNLMSQVPTCLRALSFAAKRWKQKSEGENWLNAHFHKVAVACLAPGTASILCQDGAIRRLQPADRAALDGGPEFVAGVAMLEVYLLLDHHAKPWGDRSFLKDMLDVLGALPAPTDEELAAAGDILWELHHPSAGDALPDVAQIRSAARNTTGELAALRDCRAALRKLVALVNEGERDKAILLPLAAAACGRTDGAALLELIGGNAHHVRLVEIGRDDIACPACFLNFPVAAQVCLKKATNVHRCGNCAALVVRSLEQ